MVRTLRCGRSNPGSNPGHGIFSYPKLVNRGYNQRQSSVGSHTLESLSVNTTRDQHFYPVLRERELPRTKTYHPKAFKLTAQDYRGVEKFKTDASAGNRTRINCLEGSYADHYTTDAFPPPSDKRRDGIRKLGKTATRGP